LSKIKQFDFGVPDTSWDNKARFGLVHIILFLSIGWVSAQTPDLSPTGSGVLTSQDSVRFIDGDRLPLVTQEMYNIKYDSAFVGDKLRKRDQLITVFGYYRLFVYGRNMTDAYPNLEPFERAYDVGDAYREPMLSLNVVARPNGRSSFGTELFVFAPYNGSGFENNTFSTNLGINFYGNFRTSNGTFGVRAGGIHWYNLSPFTIGVFQILDRFSIFDRTPWEGVNNTLKYNSYFQTGATSPGDLRWNNQAFQGLILNGAKLPGDLDFDLFWGKTQLNGGLAGGLVNDPNLSIPPTLDAGSVPTYIGFAGVSRNLPSVIRGGKLSKAFNAGKQVVAYNTIHSRTALDSINKDAIQYAVHTLSLNLSVLNGVKIKGELGGGNFESPNYGKKWGEALMMRFFVPKKYTFLETDFQIYQISQNFFNQNGEIATNSNPDILAEAGLLLGANGAGGQLALVNQLVHNRRGLNINTGYEIGPAKFIAGWGISEEIDPVATSLSYVHRINGLALSRIYNPFPANATGPTVFDPYGRKFSFFRGASEVVQTTDLDAANAETLNRKYFQAVDLQAKVKLQAFNKELFLFYLGSFGSVKTEASLIPSLSDQSYLFVQYHEMDIYYEILPRFIITTYIGLEYAKGGAFTDWDAETQLPRDQVGQAYGVGFDWTITENAGLYVRQRWMKFNDRSFGLDNYEGHETTIELKVFF